MNQTSLKKELIWNITQEPRCPAYQPASYMLFLSAMDKGWQVSEIRLEPSWDQHGFIYLVTLRHPELQRSQELIMPRCSLTDELLNEIGVSTKSKYPLIQPFLWYG